jgi:phosphoglycerate kinase
MANTSDRVLKLCRVLKGLEPHQKLSLADYLAAIPRLSALADVPAGTPVLVRGDVDAKPGPTIGEGDIRLRSMRQTLEVGRQRGFKQIVFGHLGRKQPDKPIGSLKKVAARLGEILGCEVTLIDDWLDEGNLQVRQHVTERINAAASGSVLMLENVRAYDIETVLWKANDAALPEIAGKLARLANALAAGVASIYVNEALSAGSLDASTTAVPLAMQRVALGDYVAGEFEGPMQECLQAQLVVFSGIKIDKLDDLEAMIARGTIRTILSAGSLAMALKKADARLSGSDFSLGVSEDRGHQGKPYYIPPERIEQAQRMIQAGHRQGIEFVLPVDFKLGDERVVEKLAPGDQQFDVGPRTIAHFEQKISAFIDARRGQPTVAFHNGVFGMFEDARFESGTREFMKQLKRMKDAGIKVYIGGGEGGTALEKYGQPDWVTHVFTAGGTVLNALGAEPVPYLVALKQAAAGE